MVENFEEVKYWFLLTIMAFVEMAAIPFDFIINWDQTGIKYIPVSELVDNGEGGIQKVEIAGFTDKRHITAVFAGT